jgi:hypothetical protein
MSADGTAGLPNSIITRPRVRRQSTAYRGTAAAASRCALDRAGGTLATSGAAWRERCQPTGLPSRRRCQPAGASLATGAIFIADERSDLANRQRLRFVVSSANGVMSGTWRERTCDRSRGLRVLTPCRPFLRRPTPPPRQYTPGCGRSACDRSQCAHGPPPQSR